MGKYFIRRLLGLIPLFIAVVVISFFLMQFAPGGPEQAMKESKKLTNAQAADFTAQANAIKTSLGC